MINEILSTIAIIFAIGILINIGIIMAYMNNRQRHVGGNYAE
jgi:hypothetical protein